MSVSLQRSSRDLRITIPAVQGGGTLACMVARGKGVDGRRFKISRVAVPAEEGAPKRLRETSQTYSDWSRGAGFGKAGPGTEGGYSHGTFLYARSRNLLMPTGELTELEIPATVQGIHSAFDLDGYTYLTTLDDGMLTLTNAGTEVTAADTGVVITSGTTLSSAVFLGKAWITNGTSTRIWSFDGTTWAAATDDVKFNHLAVTNWTFGAQMALNAGLIGRSERTLIATGTTLPEVSHNVSNPGLSAAWAGPNSVGDSLYPIAALHAAGDAVFAAKPDGVFLIEGGGQMRNLAPHWRAQYDPDNGSTLQFYDQFLLAGHSQFLDMVSPNPEQVGLQMECQPGASESFENGPTGRALCQTTDSGYVLTAFWDGTRSYIWAGRRTDRLGLNSRNPMTWYGSECDVAGAVTMLHILPSVDGGPRWLVIATREDTPTTGYPHLYVQSLPKEPTPYAAWKAGSSHRFARSFTCAFSSDDLGDPSSPKNMRYVAAVTENATSARSLVVSTSTDTGTPVIQVISESGRDVSVFDEATNPGVNVQVSLTGTSDPTEPLVVRSIKVRGTINDERTLTLNVPLELGRDLTTNRATTDPGSPFIKRVQLYALLEAGPVTCVDWFGQERTIVVEDVSDDEILDDDGEGVTIYANATITILSTNARYGSAIYGVSRFS